MAKESAKKPTPKKPAVAKAVSKTAKKPLANTTKKVSYVEGTSNYYPNTLYKTKMTPDQMKAFNKLKSDPKFADTLFTLPKGAEKLSVEEKKQMQARRLRERKRTLARAESVIRRTVGQPKIGGNSYTTKETKKATPKPKKSDSKKVFGPGF